MADCGQVPQPVHDGMRSGRCFSKCRQVRRYSASSLTKTGNSNPNGVHNGQQRQQQWRGAQGAGQRGRGRGQWRNQHETADEEKEPDAGKGKGGKKGKSGKAGGKASGKPGGRRKRDGKGDADPKPARKKKDDVTCFNCGETGHYKNQCKNPLQITNGDAEADE